MDKAGQPSEERIYVFNGTPTLSASARSCAGCTGTLCMPAGSAALRFMSTFMSGRSYAAANGLPLSVGRHAWQSTCAAALILGSCALLRNSHAAECIHHQRGGACISLLHMEPGFLAC